MADTIITSRHNPLVGRFKAAAAGQGEWMLLDGEHLLEEALAAGVQLDVVAADPERVPAAALTRWRRRLGHDRVAAAGARVLEAMSPVRAPGGVVALAARPRADARQILAAPDALVVAAVDVQDPGNIGAIVRAAEAGGATGVLTTTGGADPFGWKALRGAMGSAFRLPVARVASIEVVLPAARDAGLQVVAAAGRGQTPLDSVCLTGPTLLLVGSEGRGLSPALAALADAQVSIPMAPAVESLNVAVAAALLVYEARRQRLSAHSQRSP